MVTFYVLASEEPQLATRLVKRLLDLIGMFVGGWVGWTAGAAISFFTAFIVSVVGTGLGLYAIRRLTRGIS